MKGALFSMTTNQKIQVAHEIRMWFIGIGAIAVPIGYIAYRHRYEIKDWFKNQKAKIVAKRKK